MFGVTSEKTASQGPDLCYWHWQLDPRRIQAALRQRGALRVLRVQYMNSRAVWAVASRWSLPRFSLGVSSLRLRSIQPSNRSSGCEDICATHVSAAKMNINFEPQRSCPQLHTRHSCCRPSCCRQHSFQIAIYFPPLGDFSYFVTTFRRQNLGISAAVSSAHHCGLICANRTKLNKKSDSKTFFWGTTGMSLIFVDTCSLTVTIDALCSDIQIELIWWFDFCLWKILD